jgi:imidazolonepropionase-like amidohydrolase
VAPLTLKGNVVFNAPMPSIQPRLRRISPDEQIAFVGSTLLDGAAGPPKHNVTIVVDGGIVTSVGDVNPDELNSAEIVDCRDTWITPGLIDCHAHLNGETAIDPYRRYLVPSPGLKLFYAARQMAAALATGFTTLRDVGVGSAVALREGVRHDVIVGPRILAANSAITTTGGHGDWTLFPPDFRSAIALRGTVADGVDECLRATRRAFREGADLIKVIPSGGGVTNHPDDLVAHVEMSPDELAAIVDEAHRRHARVAAHTNGVAAAKAVIEAGVDTMEHGVFDPDPALLDAMVQRNISLIPTLLIFRWVAEDGAAAGIFAAGVEAAKRLLEVQLRLVAAAHESGVTIAVGSDNGGFMPIDENTRELELLMDAGLSFAETLAAATRNGARACGLEAEVGTIEPGKRADLIILNDDPAADVSILRRPGGIREVVQAA